MLENLVSTELDIQNAPSEKLKPGSKLLTNAPTQ